MDESDSIDCPAAPRRLHEPQSEPIDVGCRECLPPDTGSRRDPTREDAMRPPVSAKPTDYDEMNVTPGQADAGCGPYRAGRSFGRNALTIIGGVVLASIAVCVLANLDDIRRYIRISTM